MRMRNLLVLFSLLASISSCHPNTTTTIEGDLYFKLIDFQRFFDAPDSILTKIENSVKSVNRDTLSDQDKKIYELLEFMTDKQLLRKPFIRLRQDDGKIIMLFLDQPDYEKIKEYHYGDLVSDDKKIRIKAEVSELRYDTLTAYETVRLISVEKIDGKTYWKK